MTSLTTPLGRGAIRNPVIPGFAPDPSILRVGTDYFLATSTLEWLPGIRLFHSTDLRDWQPIGHVLEAHNGPDLRGVHPSGGVWAPCLTYHEPTGTFFITYSVMKNQTGNQFDVDNFVVTSRDIRGPWSSAHYLNSVGFDPSLFHDDDGRSWLVTLEWDPREGYEHPGPIVLEEFSRDRLTVVGDTTRIYRGATDRGCLEGAHLYKHDGLYYIMAAEGGTGFGHSATLARSSSLTGPWEADPNSPFITSWTPDFFGRQDLDYLKPHYFDPAAEMHKAGHGSLVQTPSGEWYVAHLSSRPIDHASGSILGRECSIQQVEWSPEGWLRLTSEGRAARAEVSIPSDTPTTPHAETRFVREDFDDELSTRFLMAPRRYVSSDWADTTSRPGHLRLRGADSLYSRLDVSLLAVRLQALQAIVSTKIDCSPRHFSHAAGLTVYYNNENFTYLRLYHSESLGGRALGIINAREGSREELVLERVAVPDGPLELRARISDGHVDFSWASDAGGGGSFAPIDIGDLSDEATGGFTGLALGITAQDAYRHDFYADFDWFAADYN